MHYTRIASERQLIERLREPGAVILCGGTDLLVRMRSGLATPEHLLDISDLRALRGIRDSGGFIEIGAATPESDLLSSPLVRERLPLLTAALSALGSIQIRNRGTLGGNLVNASPAADSAIPLLSYDAKLVLRSASGERTVDTLGFFVGPGKTILNNGEYVRTVSIPLPERDHRTFYHKVGKRKALMIAIASVGVVASVSEGRITTIRIAAGSVAPKPLRLCEVERSLAGRNLDEGVVAEAGRLAALAVSPIDDIRATATYRRDVVGELVKRALRGFVAG